ncbi:MAG: PAS domain-containing protein [Gammaproteobacteria bacterium]
MSEEKVSIEKTLILNENITLEETIAQLPEHVYWKNKEGVTLGSNNLNAQHLGLQCSAEMIGKTDYDVLSQEQANKLRANDQEVMRTGLAKIVEETGFLPNGDAVLYLSHKTPWRNNHNEIIGILGISIDITNTRKEEIERLKILENIIALMPGHVYWVNTENIYLGCNDNQAKSAGLKSREEIVGKRNKDLPWNFNSCTLPETLDQINQEVMRTGKAKITEEPAILPDGTEAIFLSNKVPLRDEEGKITGMVGISFDITEKKRTEKELHETQNKLAGMTQISAAIAHELRTPLRAIGSSASGLKDYVPKLLETYRIAKKTKLPIPDINPIHQKSLAPLLGVIESEIQSAMTVIEMLLIRLNQEEGEKELVACSMRGCIDAALKRYPFDTGERGLIHWEVREDFLFRGKELLVVHILFNLLKNALYYIGAVHKGGIYITLGQQDGMNKLYFKDTGMGISADIYPYIFDQFFSKTHHGAGIGLSFCKTVMRSFEGDITCQSIEGEYTEFTLSFPIMREVV